VRNIPANLPDLLYMAQKIGLAPLRGLVAFPFLARGSGVPFLGPGVKLICQHRIKVGRLVWIGGNCYVDAFCTGAVTFGPGVTIRENSTIQCRSGLGQPGAGLSVGANTFIGPCAKIGVGGQVNIGSNTQIGAHCTFNAESHADVGGSYTSGAIRRVGIDVGDDVWIGDGVTVLDGVRIGRGAVIGAGSVVNRDVPPNEVHAGVPARKIMK